MKIPKILSITLSGFLAAGGLSSVAAADGGHAHVSAAHSSGRGPAGVSGGRYGGGRYGGRYYGGRYGRYYGRGFGYGGSIFIGDFGYPYYGYGYPYYAYDYPYGYPGYAAYYADGTVPPVYNGTVAGENGRPAHSGLVAELQQRLKRGGYYSGAVDGVLGKGTRRAIRSYERDHNLPVDGEIGERLLNRIGLA